jgi:hypothetical protein
MRCKPRQPARDARRAFVANCSQILKLIVVQIRAACDKAQTHGLEGFSSLARPRDYEMQNVL